MDALKKIGQTPKVEYMDLEALDFCGADSWR